MLASLLVWVFRYFNSKLTIPMPRSKSRMIKIYILPLRNSWNSLITSWTKCCVINVVCLSIIIWRCKLMSIQIRRSTKLCKSASIIYYGGDQWLFLSECIMFVKLIMQVAYYYRPTLCDGQFYSMPLILNGKFILRPIIWMLHGMTR